MHTVTSDALLQALLDPGNHTVWQSWVERYRPLLVAYARRLGVGSEDAEDLAQDVLLAFAKCYREGRYDRAKGRLRAWLFGIASMTVRHFFERRPPREIQVVEPSEATGLLQRVEDEDRLAALWEEEWRAAVVAQCLEEVRREVEPRTFEAFRLFVHEELSAREVAQRCEMTENAVYSAKRRVLERIRELHPRIEEIW